MRMTGRRVGHGHAAGCAQSLRRSGDSDDHQEKHNQGKFEIVPVVLVGFDKATTSRSTSAMRRRRC